MKIATLSICLMIAGSFTGTASAQIAEQSSSGYVERLTGPLAKAHLDNLRARHPSAFQKARAELLKKGWKDTGRIEVVRTNRQARGRVVPAPLYDLVQSASSAEGEILAWYYDDGDYNTWEGTIYVHEYSSGTWMTVNSQMWMTENNEWRLVWYSLVDGEDSPNRDPFNNMSHPNMGQDSGVRLASFTPGSIQPAGFGEVLNKWEAWASCTAFGCAGATAACWRQNPTPPREARCGDLRGSVVHWSRDRLSWRTSLERASHERASEDS